MDSDSSSAIFLITGLITACGTHEAMPILQRAQTKIVNKQYLEAIFAAEQIVKHYPETAFAKSAQRLIHIVNSHHLDGEYYPDL